ncbi:MAG: hypothetical protein ACREXS_19110 [Gammaproteobacteria bacterium]
MELIGRLRHDVGLLAGITITTGKLDSGTLASLRASDGNTYDVRSVDVAANGGGVTDWYASVTMSGSPSAVTQITMTYAGQYVSRHVYLYDFTTNSWDLVDTRSVGNKSDVKVTMTVATNPQRYVSPEGQMRARVRGVRAGAQSTTAWKFYCWANLLRWEVKQTVTDVPGRMIQTLLLTRSSLFTGLGGGAAQPPPTPPWGNA